MPDPVGFRTRYRSEPGMIGNYPWTYADARRRSKIERTEYEREDLYTTEQMKQYGHVLLEAAIAAIHKDEIRGKVLPFGKTPPAEGLNLGQEWALEAAQAAIRKLKGTI